MNLRNIVFSVLTIFVKLLFSQGSVTFSDQQNLFNTSDKSNSWRLVSSSVYTPSNISNTDTVWEFKTRDTILYNEFGMQIARVLNFSYSGWEPEDIHQIDSNVYIDKRIVKKMTKFISDNKISSLSFCSEFAYGNNNQNYTQKQYRWDTVQQKWKEDTTYRYTVKCSAPIDNIYNDSNFNFLNFKEICFATYSLTQIDTECTVTTLALEKKTGSLLQKVVYLFNSPELLRKNIVKEILLEQNVDSKSFDTLELKVYNENGYEYYYRSGNKLTLYQAFIRSKDSHNNDTSFCFIVQNSNEEHNDTSSKERCVRTYDVFGNNTETIDLSFNFSENRWTAVKKRVNKFAMYPNTLPIKKRIQLSSNASYSKCREFITINASGISSVKIVNAVGQSVFSSKSNKNSVTINLTKLKKPLNAGIYYVGISYNKNEYFSFPIFNE